MSVMVSLLLGLVLSVQPGQTPPGGHTLGKSMAEVVEMGREKWFEFYTSQRGESTMAMAEAERTYGMCLTYINSQKIEELEEEEQRWYSELRAQLAVGEEKSVSCAYALTGGGTIWTPVMAGSTADVEEVIQDLLKPRRDMPKAKQTVFWDKLKQAFERVESRKEFLNSDLNPTGTHHGDAHAMVREIERSFSNTVSLIRSKPQNVRERVLAAYVEMLDTVLTNWD